MSEWLLAGALWAAKKTADKYFEIYFDDNETTKEIRSLRNEIMRLRDYKDKVTFLIQSGGDFNLLDHIIEDYSNA